MQVAGAVHAVELVVSVQPAGSMESTSSVVSGAFCTHGPAGITWWVWTSKMNSDPVSAWLQAAVSSGGGALKRPPLPLVRRRLRRAAPTRSGAAGELEDGERRRHGPGALQEAPPVHPDATGRRRRWTRRIISLTLPVLLRSRRPGRTRRWRPVRRRAEAGRRADRAVGGRTGRSQPWPGGYARDPRGDGRVDSVRVLRQALAQCATGRFRLFAATGASSSPNGTNAPIGIDREHGSNRAIETPGVGMHLTEPSFSWVSS